MPFFRSLAKLLLISAVILAISFSPRLSAQEKSKPTEKAAEKAPEMPAQIELLETRVRFETNGDSRKEVHAQVHINNELGVRQFARLNFDYNRSFQQVDIPLVRITHAGGGTADILPSAISDNPNPAVVNAPAYQDVRVKSVRILGLEPGDNLEYRVVTTTTHHPLAPDFWLDHTFDRTGVVSREIFELEVPDSRKPDIRINPAIPTNSLSKSGEGEFSLTLYHWDRTTLESKKISESAKETEPDVAVSTEQWEMLSIRLDEKLTPGAKPLESLTTYDEHMRESERPRTTPELNAKAQALTKNSKTNRQRLRALYDFVSQKIGTVDLPPGSTGFLARRPEDVLASGYGIPEDKFVLLRALAAGINLGAEAALTGYCDKNGLARPTVFKHLIVRAYDGKKSIWLDPALEIAPFGLILPDSGRCAFVLNRGFYALNSTGHQWEELKTEPPFPSTQRVSIDARLDSDGGLKSKVRYAMRGQNELLLRLAFHQSPKEKWNEVAQLLALSDGFRGKITNATASDPYATKRPFTVEYEVMQPKFVDWSKKPVRIPALLPMLGLPDPPAKKANSETAIELGTPLDVETEVTLHLPADTVAGIPTGSSVERDYATFASRYSSQNHSVTASRHLKFILRQIPSARAADYNAFVRAVQTDEAQELTLERPDGPSGKTPSPVPVSTPTSKP